jgi:putative Mg2+ transporter-C (MgtC) family protein
MTWEEMALRLGSATAIGLVFGLDRELHGHPAGLRTHALVALSSAVIMVSSLVLFEELRSDNVQPDPLRAIQGLAQAIGFIAAGLIFVRNDQVRNMTTAANLWVCSALGIACGAGQYRIAALGFVFGVIVLVVLRVFERYLPKAEGD